MNKSNLSIEKQICVYSYLTINQFCEKHKAFKIGGVRSQIFNASQNELAKSGAIVRNGRKILIKESAWTRQEVKQRLEAGEELSTLKQTIDAGGWRLSAVIYALKRDFELPIMSYRRKRFDQFYKLVRCLYQTTTMTLHWLKFFEALAQLAEALAQLASDWGF